MAEIRDVRIPDIGNFDEVTVLGLAMTIGRAHFANSFAMSSATAAACSRISGTAIISQ